MLTYPAVKLGIFWRITGAAFRGIGEIQADDCSLFWDGKNFACKADSHHFDLKGIGQ